MSVSSEFIGVDQDAYGDGDEDAQPIDTWLQTRLYNNILQCRSLENPYCFTPMITSADDLTTLAGLRPYASFLGQTVWLGALPVIKDQEQFRFTLLYHSTIPGSTYTGAKTQVRIRVGPNLTSGGDDKGWVDLTGTYSAGELTGHQTLTVPFERPAVRNGLVTVIIMVRSTVAAPQATTIGASSNGQTSTLITVPPYLLRETNAATEFWTPNSAGTAPDADSREAMFFQADAQFLQSSAEARYIDLLYVEDVGTEGSEAIALQTVPALLTLDESNPGGGTAWLHQCFMLRALTVEPVMGLRSSIIQAGALASNVDFTSGPATEMVKLTKRAYLQPVIAGMGPRGLKKSSNNTETDGDVFDHYDYAMHWPYVFGDYDDGATTGRENTLVNDSIYLTTENPRLELRCTWLSIQHGAPYRSVVKVEAKGPKQDDFEKLDYDESDGTGSAQWNMSVTIDQMDSVASTTAAWGTNSTSYGGFTDRKKRIDVWGAPSEQFLLELPPVLRGSNYEVNSPKTGSGDYGFWFKEGSLFQDDLDAGLLVSTSDIITTSGMDATDTARPFRLNIEMALSSFDGPLQIDETNLDDKLQLYLVSYTLIEHPELP